jgi:hypothetical protein
VSGVGCRVDGSIVIEPAAGTLRAQIAAVTPAMMVSAGPPLPMYITCKLCNPADPGRLT